MTSKYAQYSSGDPEWDVLNEQMLAKGPAVPEGVPIDYLTIRKSTVNILVLLTAALSVPGMYSQFISAHFVLTGMMLRPETGISVKDHEIDVNGGKITVRSYTPDGDSPTSTFPLMVWYHGDHSITSDHINKPS